MATTLPVSPYFLTCCRPIFNPFCFLVEKPKLINYYNYPFEYFLKHPLSGCKHNHENLFDHSLNAFNVCTDDRAWSLDDRQKRQHFNDLICGRIPHCGPNDTSEREGKGTKDRGRKPKQDPVAVKSELPQEQKQVTIKQEKKEKDEKKKGEKNEDLKDDESQLKSISSEGVSEGIGEHPPEDVSQIKSMSSKGVSEGIGENPLEEVSLHPEDSLEEKILSAGQSKEYVPSVKSQKSEELRGVPSDKSQKSKELGVVPSDKSQKSKELEAVPSDKSQKSKELGAVPSDKSQKSKELGDVSSDKSTESEELGETPSMGSEESEQIGMDPKDLTDELIEKLDRNLRNLESTFDKFVKKNRDFIQNLVECLDFEKQKQKALEDDYNKLKQENEELKTQNDYLKMVNNKQLDLFKNELDRGITENKVIYKRKIHLMERQLQNDQNELQMYKQTEKQYMEVVEQDNEKIEKLNNKVEDLKNKEVQLVKNYLQLLRFLENVKNILSSADPKEIPQLRSLNTITDSSADNDPEVKRVLKDALTNGVSTLNVRDLSILHDAIEGLNDNLCHQTDKCTKSPTAADTSSFPDFSTMSIHRIRIEHSHERLPKQFEGYDTSSNLSVDKIPTNQKPKDHRVRFD